jgi:hypothetical protein
MQHRQQHRQQQMRSRWQQQMRSRWQQEKVKVLPRQLLRS